MATQSPRERTTLTRDAVIDAALARVDSDGLEALSFRRLAADLGVTPMALYRYVASKDELLAAIVDRAYGEFELPSDADMSWQDQLRTLGRSFRKVLLAHPSIAAVERSGEGRPSVDGLRITEVLLGVLHEAGFSLEDAAQLHELLAQFVLALVLLETGGGPQRAPEEQEERARALRAKLLFLPEGEFPNVLAAADYLCAVNGPQVSFELALDLMVGGLERLLAQA